MPRGLLQRVGGNSDRKGAVDMNSYSTDEIKY